MSKQERESEGMSKRRGSVEFQARRDPGGRLIQSWFWGEKKPDQKGGVTWPRSCRSLVVEQWLQIQGSNPRLAMLGELLGK